MSRRPDSWPPYRQARCLSLDIGAGRYQFCHRCGLCPVRRHADDDVGRPETDQKKQTGTLRESFDGLDVLAIWSEWKQDVADRYGLFDTRQPAAMVKKDADIGLLGC